MIRRSSWAGLLGLLAICATEGHSQQLVLHEGDRVVFYGDSITAQRLYTRFVEDFLLTRYPQMHLTFWNAGIPGDTVYGGYTGDMPSRLRRDLLPHQPTVVTIMLGMNDGYYMAFDEKYLDNFRDGYHKLVSAIESGAPTARVTLISSTPYDEITHGTEFRGYNEVVGRYAAFVRDLAISSHFAFSNFNEVETNLLHTGTLRNSSLAALLIPDRIHPAEASQWVMAAALANSWGVSPIVSSVQLDGAAGRTVVVENTQLTDMKVGDGEYQWTQTDNALPLPLPLGDAMIQFVLSNSELSAMDQELLAVTGLPAASYTLKIDGKRIASFTRDQLSRGINLALYATPMEEQAKGVDGLELKRTRLDEARFLLGVEDPKVANPAAAISGLDEKGELLAVEQRNEAQPKPHRFELFPE